MATYPESAEKEAGGDSAVLEFLAAAFQFNSELGQG